MDDSVDPTRLLLEHEWSLSALRAAVQWSVVVAAVLFPLSFWTFQDVSKRGGPVVGLLAALLWPLGAFVFALLAGYLLILGVGVIGVAAGFKGPLWLAAFWIPVTVFFVRWQRKWNRKHASD